MYTSLLLFGGLGLNEVVIIALVVLLLFGGKKIPELMKGMGRGVKSFKEGMSEISSDTKEDQSSTIRPSQDNVSKSKNEQAL